MTVTKPNQPEFWTPPLTQVAQAIEFAPLRGFHIPHIGLLWEPIREEFPKYNVIPSLPASQDTYSWEEARSRQGVSVAVNIFDVRCQFLHKDGHRLLQIQNDRLVQNWRGTGSEYPKFEAVHACFIKEWERFVAFTKAEKMSSPSVAQCEITYVNELPQGQGWETLDDVGGLFRSWGFGVEGHPAPETIGMQVNYLVDKTTRLRVEIKHMVNSSDLSESLQVILRTRGRPAGNSSSEITQWMQKARDYANNAFRAIMSESIKKKWKEKINV